MYVIVFVRYAAFEFLIFDRCLLSGQLSSGSLPEVLTGAGVWNPARELSEAVTWSV